MRYSLRIISGRGEGKKIGIPTLNFKVASEIKEEHGIYAGWIWIANEKHPAVFHWGPIPAYGISEPSLEAHLLDIKLEGSPEIAEIEMTSYLRPIENFQSSEALATQIQVDIQDARKLLEGEK